MPNQRAPGKKLIGAQATPALWAAIDQWLEGHPLNSVTDFVLNACIEKLKREGVPISLVDALADARRRGSAKYRIANRRRMS
jgi:hypothetical protein